MWHASLEKRIQARAQSALPSAAHQPQVKGLDADRRIPKRILDTKTSPVELQKLPVKGGVVGDHHGSSESPQARNPLGEHSHGGARSLSLFCQLLGVQTVDLHGALVKGWKDRF